MIHTNLPICNFSFTSKVLHVPNVLFLHPSTSPQAYLPLYLVPTQTCWDPQIRLLQSGRPSPESLTHESHRIWQLPTLGTEMQFPSRESQAWSWRPTGQASTPKLSLGKEGRKELEAARCAFLVDYLHASPRTRAGTKAQRSTCPSHNANDGRLQNRDQLTIP